MVLALAHAIHTDLPFMAQAGRTLVRACYQQGDPPGSFNSVNQLVQRIEHFVAADNTNGQPFKWIATADSILEKLHRLCSRGSGTVGRRGFVAIAGPGKGIPSADLARLFGPFLTTKPARKGTGLGLSTSRDIVQDHRERIDVDNSLGQGGTFTV